MTWKPYSTKGAYRTRARARYAYKLETDVSRAKAFYYPDTTPAVAIEWMEDTINSLHAVKSRPTWARLLRVNLTDNTAIQVREFRNDKKVGARYI